MSKSNQTYDFICFSDLAYEFNPSDSYEVQKKIKRRLKYYKLGLYDQKRVDYIRHLKNELYDEITKYDKSIYYKKAQRKYANPDDFNLELLKNDYLKRYPLINEEDLGSMINFAIYLYYLR